MTDPRNETDPLPNGWTWEQAINAALGRIAAEPYTEGSLATSAVARLIAQHEKPPVDEATEVWREAWTAWRDGHVPATNCTKAIAIIRDALAKARAGK